MHCVMSPRNVEAVEVQAVSAEGAGTCPSTRRVHTTDPGHRGSLVSALEALACTSIRVVLAYVMMQVQLAMRPACLWLVKLPCRHHDGCFDYASCF